LIIISEFDILGGAPVSLARNSAAAEKRGRAKIPSPQPPSFLPARASGFVSAARSAAISQEFPSKNVRAELYNSTSKDNAELFLLFTRVVLIPLIEIVRIFL